MCARAQVTADAAALEGEPEPFACDKCDYRAGRKANLVRHARVHDIDAKEHKCNTCGFVAMQKAELKAHVMEHTGEKPFACDVCE